MPDFVSKAVQPQYPIDILKACIKQFMQGLEAALSKAFTRDFFKKQTSDIVLDFRNATPWPPSVITNLSPDVPGSSIWSLR